MISILSLCWQIWRELIFARKSKIRFSSKLVKYGFGTKNHVDAYHILVINNGRVEIVIEEVTLKVSLSKMSHNADLGSHDYTGKIIKPNDYLESYFPLSLFVHDCNYELHVKLTNGKVFKHQFKIDFNARS